MGALLLEVVLLVVQLLLLAAIAVFLVRILVWVISGHLDVPFVPTPPRYASTVALALEVWPGDVVYELGSGDGRFVLACASLSPRSRFVGIERNPLLHAAALFRRYRAGNPGNVEFRRGNFFRTDFSEANKVYAYLLDSVMYRLQPKFEREFKGRVASRAFPFARKELSNVIALTETVGAHGQHLLFVYDF
ncbi:MAG TPA: class I SAM-dependent methyltransferase [Candidatus Paceibacterota bacterium]|nr:class I SAM-dependent methyltransferase [Candidatus Paceibacterota bacterium]